MNRLSNIDEHNGSYSVIHDLWNIFLRIILSDDKKKMKLRIVIWH